MDFTVPDDVTALAGLTRQVLEREVLGPDGMAELLGKTEGFDAGLWAWLSAAGILSAGLPVSAGGDDLGLLGHCAVLTEIGRTVAPAPYLWSIVVGAAAIDRFGTSAQRRLWAAPAGRGELVLTAALSADDQATGAPGTQSPVTASPAGSRWVLSGTVATVDAATRADLILVPAATVPSGVILFLVEPGDDGLFVTPQQLVDGGGAGQITLGGVELGADRVLGSVESGPAIHEWLASHALVGLCAQQLGVLERALELTASYTRSREAFGKPIGSFQAVAQRLADAWINVEALRLSMWQAAWRLDAGLPAETEVAIAKFWAAEAGHHVAHTAIHLHGGVGIDVSYPLHRYFTAAKRLEFSLGGATAHLRSIGATLAR
jgi:acyl-CoA dehydrogenase